MSRRLKLDVFKAHDATEAEADQVSAVVFEDARLAAYETGYSAGWEDAITAQADDQTRLHADFAQNLEALSFTYHEARGHVLRTLEPLLRDMVAKVLPDTARQALGQIVLDTLRPVAATLAATPVCIVLHPASRVLVEPLLRAKGTFPFTIVEESSLGEMQAYLRLGDTEQRVDLDGVIASIATAVDSFFHIERQGQAHG